MNLQPDSIQLAQALGNRFVIEKKIGEGGQAVVFLATRLKLQDGSSSNDKVAIKLHRPGSDAARIEREIDALHGFEHPCLARFLEYGTVQLWNDDVKYVAWAFIPGIDLRLILVRGKLNPLMVAAIGRDVSRAIEHIWLKRVVHRDINPKNVIVRDDGSGAVLIDLGVARHLERTTLTAPGGTWGTMGYMSPEQISGGSLTCLSDVFSLAVTLQEALSGRHPTSNDQAKLLTCPRTAVIAPATPVALAELLDRCLSVRPAFRPTPTLLAQSFSNIVAMLG
jgi:serine/threonine-protein kinase